jgi:hypothetical protein
VRLKSRVSGSSDLDHGTSLVTPTPIFFVWGKGRHFTISLIPESLGFGFAIKGSNSLIENEQYLWLCINNINYLEKFLMFT